MAVDLALESAHFLGGEWFLLYFHFGTLSSLYMSQILGIQF